LLCQCYVIRETVGVLPRGIRREFVQDLEDLEDAKLGVERQLRTVARIWRVWGKYLR
jgi:ATP synthase regulation protein NCA2